MKRQAHTNPKDFPNLTESERVSLVDDIMTRGVYEIIENNPGELKKQLLHDQLRIKFGTDPSSPNIHYGRAVSLLKLRDFQLLGHKVVLIIGDFTGEVGDTSDKEAGRPMLKPEQVEKNMRTYVQQVSKILDMDKVELHYNSDWLSKLTFGDISRLADTFGLNEFISRDLIKRRIDKGHRVSLREVLYPLMQGYDSLAIDSDLEIGGDDQKFNLLAGRAIQARFGKKKQAILMTNLIPGTDGEKMSSSAGNSINISDDPDNLFGKVMSARDEVIVTYFTHCTRVPMDKISQIAEGLKNGSTNPRDAKLLLAHVMTAQIHGEKMATRAEDKFKVIFQQKDIPTDVPSWKIETPDNIVSVLVRSGLVSSRGEAKRLLVQKGVKVDGQIVSDEFVVKPGSLLQKGKRVFLKIE